MIDWWLGGVYRSGACGQAVLGVVCLVGWLLGCSGWLVSFFYGFLLVS